MKLYWVDSPLAEWGAYIFANSRNQARTMSPEIKWGGEEYINIRAKVMGETNKVNEPVVVECSEHPLYPLVVEMGHYYYDPDTDEKIEPVL